MSATAELPACDSDSEKALATGFYSDCSQTPPTSAASSLTGDDGRDKERKAIEFKEKHGIRPIYPRSAYYFYAMKHGGKIYNESNQTSDKAEESQGLILFTKQVTAKRRTINGNSYLIVASSPI